MVVDLFHCVSRHQSDHGRTCGSRRSRCRTIHLQGHAHRSPLWSSRDRQSRSRCVRSTSGAPRTGSSWSTGTSSTTSCGRGRFGGARRQPKRPAQYQRPESGRAAKAPGAIAVHVANIDPHLMTPGMTSPPCSGAEQARWLGPFRGKRTTGTGFTSTR